MTEQTDKQFVKSKYPKAILLKKIVDGKKKFYVYIPFEQIIFESSSRQYQAWQNAKKQIEEESTDVFVEMNKNLDKAIEVYCQVMSEQGQLLMDQLNQNIKQAIEILQQIEISKPMQLNFNLDKDIKWDTNQK